MSQGWLVAIYLAAFVAEIGGVILIVTDLLADRQDAKRLLDEEPFGEEPTTLSFFGGAMSMSGAAGEQMARNFFQLEQMRRFHAARIGGSLGKKGAGVALVVIGSALSLVGNIAAL